MTDTIDSIVVWYLKASFVIGVTYRRDLSMLSAGRKKVNDAA